MPIDVLGVSGLRRLRKRSWLLGLLVVVGICGSLWTLIHPNWRPWRNMALDTAIPSANAAAAPADLALDADIDPESGLARILSSLEENRLDNALAQTEALLQRYPNYRLAHLIKGDLLLARAHPLPGFGAASDAPVEKIADLRSEAIARLQGYQQKPPAGAIPRYLLQMSQAQKYAIVIDTRKSRLYLYKNDAERPRLVSDYYVSQGKSGADKKSEGDRRTPLGVYHITSYIPPEKLADMYGNGAYPINYPNEWDKRQGRSGYGIWLHGTPSDTYSRPPQASDGCVVLANPDFDKLGKNVQIGQTPVIISHGVEWLTAADWQRERAELASQVEQWRADWESLDTERYLAHYSPRFKSRDQDFSRFAEQKRQVNQGKNWIKIKLRQLSMFRNPALPGMEEEIAVVTFEQDYASNNLVNSMRKRQYWLRENGQWKILYEGNA
ncbi:MAG: L,D-transpeptidase family protein [Zoogloeaceae bacterium]|nr:L,D-transpeptidase family protein [Zoogloeaceae bacterium]